MGSRIKVGPGVSIYQQWKAWWIDARGGGERIRRSLHTSDRPAAIQKALDIFNRRTTPPAEDLNDEAVIDNEKPPGLHVRAERVGD